MDSLGDLSHSQFYSFCDVKKQIWGFDLMSIYNLINKNINNNPYNRQPFPCNVINDVKSIIRLSKICGDVINIDIEQEEELPLSKQIELRINYFIQ